MPIKLEGLVHKINKLTGQPRISCVLNRNSNPPNNIGCYLLVQDLTNGNVNLAQINNGQRGMYYPLGENFRTKHKMESELRALIYGVYLEYHYPN